MPAIKTTRLQALAAELAATRAEQRPIADEAALRSVARELKLSALCLSGGGIRSAAFCLGILQGLARGRLLAQFDYLSTVSGGGYIGSWLQAMIHERGSPTAAEEALADPNEPPVEFRRLRNYTSYLAPEAGLFSTDTWANIVLYLRNVLLNWTVYLPLLVLPVLLAIFYRTTIWVIGGHAWAADVTLVIGAALLAASIFYAAGNLPDHRPLGAAGHEYATIRAITRFVYWPALGWAFLAPLSLGDSDGLSSQPAIALMIAYVAAMTAGYMAAWLARRHDPHPRLFTLNFVAFGAATVVSTALIAVGLALEATVTAPERAQALAVLAPLWLLGAQGIHSSVFVGLRRDSPLFDLDREWLARVSALKLRAGVAWAVFAGCSLLLTWVLHQPYSPPTWVAALVALASGGAGAWIGKQASSQVGAVLSAIGQSQRARTLALNTLAAIFVLGLIAVLGMVTDAVLGRVQSLIAADVLRVPPTMIAGAKPGQVETFYASPDWLLYLVQVVAVILLILGVYYVNRRVNVNRYSMHAVYRNRLTRAFLGSGRGPARRPEPFTKFDPDDNLPLASLAAELGRRTLFPVLNLTLNLTTGVAAAWSERKAMVFTATPLACGAPLLPAPGDPPERDSDARGVYVNTAAYAGMESRDADPLTAKGLSLATAMAISGAAVSPNWGYHSSTLTAFIMTLFNVRLGAWLPNPAVVDRAEDLNLARPPRSLHSMLGDLLGESGDAARAIYLSDGGHFDNLGLYEMLRRRCQFILAIDAGQDATCAFTDLGDTLRKAAIDMQITVSFDGAMRIAPRSDTTQAATAFGYAIATIHYPEQPDEPDSKLLYLKPSVLPNIPADVRAYANLHDTFPHESTLDQFFTESQFESYRALGEYQMGLVVERVRAAVPKWQQSIDIGTFLDKAVATYQQPVEAATNARS